MTVEIISVSHALTEDNEQGVATGWLPGELSDLGRERAAELGARYRNVDLAAVFASDLHRAVETAQIAFGETSVPIRLDERLRECDYGKLNGALRTVVAKERAKHIEEPFPDGQSYRQVIEATSDFLHDLTADWDGQRVLLIAHSANKWALGCLLDGLAIEDLFDTPFEWREGWQYALPTPWPGAADRSGS
jgi:broad specificity phosphatase PhoE